MDFPLLFAVPTDDGRDRVSVYQTTLLREGPDRWGESPSVILVTPYRIFHGHHDSQWPDDAYIRHAPVAAADAATLTRHDVLLVTDASHPDSEGVHRHPEGVHRQTVYPERVHRFAIYRGPWRFSGSTVFSMYCSIAIPLLTFTGHEHLRPWPTARFNRLPVHPASLDFIRAWVRRWDPATWSAEEDRTDPVPVLRPEPESTNPLPTFVTDALIADAIRRGLTCPITLEPITPTNATVTPCYHVFDADALSTWVAQHLDRDAIPTCPACKAPL
jgi:hypothetical protein